MEREQLIREIAQTPDTLVREVLNFLLLIKAQNKQTDTDLETSISQNSEITFFLSFIDEVNSEMTADKNTQLPRDLSKNLDYYLYGSPKEEE